MLVGGLLPLDPKDHDILGRVTHQHVWVTIGEFFSSIMQFSSQLSYIIYYMLSFTFHLFSQVIYNLSFLASNIVGMIVPNLVLNVDN